MRSTQKGTNASPGHESSPDWNRRQSARCQVIGEQLSADDFSKGAENWLSFGQCAAANAGDAFRLKDEKVPHPDAMMWTKKQFDGDFLAEFTFVPHTEGTNAGALFTICGKDPCPTPGQAYWVAIGKVGPTIFLVVDGKLFHQYLDGATYGPVLSAGHIGIRHWAGLDASYKDFRVWGLVRGD